MSSLTRKILVLSSGDNTGIGFCRSLELVRDRYEIIATDTNLYRLHHAVGDRRYLLPDATSEDYFPALTRLIEKEKPDLLYASDTNLELSVVTARRKELNCRTFWPPQEAIAVYENKWLTYLKCVEAKVTVPDTILVRNASDIYQAIREWKRIWLRSIYGSGGRGAIVTDDPVLAVAWVRRFDGWNAFTAAQVLGGEMATWMGIWWDGELIVGQGRKRLHWEYTNLSPTGVTGITGAQSTLKEASLRDTAIKVIGGMGHQPHGLVAVDFRYDDQGRPNPTEVQATRFYSSILFLSEAGLNLPHIYVELGLTGKSPSLQDRLDPLPSDLVWLKAVDCLPKLTTWDEICRNELQWRLY